MISGQSCDDAENSFDSASFYCSSARRNPLSFVGFVEDHWKEAAIVGSAVLGCAVGLKLLDEVVRASALAAADVFRDANGATLRLLPETFMHGPQFQLALQDGRKITGTGAKFDDAQHLSMLGTDGSSATASLSGGAFKYGGSLFPEQGVSIGQANGRFSDISFPGGSVNMKQLSGVAGIGRWTNIDFAGQSFSNSGGNFAFSRYNL